FVIPIGLVPSARRHGVSGRRFVSAGIRETTAFAGLERCGAEVGGDERCRVGGCALATVVDDQIGSVRRRRDEPQPNYPPTLFHPATPILRKVILTLRNDGQRSRGGLIKLINFREPVSRWRSILYLLTGCADKLFLTFLSVRHCAR